MKKIYRLILSLAILLGTVQGFALESDRVTVKMNDTQMQFDAEPVIENGRTMVPFRAIFEALGCCVYYSAEDGRQTVSAHRGDDSLMLVIGENKMYFNAEEMILDVPAKIVNDRTLVPLRAVSEAFDTEVLWQEDTKTVCLYPKQGAHTITPVTGTKEIKNDDGITLIQVSYSYPVIANTDAIPIIEKINEEYKAAAESFLKEAEASREEAQQQLEQMGENTFRPYVYELTYTVSTDRAGLLSIVNHKYINTGGAHGTVLKESRSFRPEAAQELKLEDILAGSLEDDIYPFVYDVFAKYFKENAGEEFQTEWAEQLKKEIRNVKYYLTDRSLVLYFDVYSVAPYAYGTPSVEIPYEEGTFLVDLTDAGQSGKYPV